MIFTIISSFFIAALSGLGVGGGGLFVVFLTLFTNTPQITAQGINLLFFLFSAGSSICIHLSRRQIFGSAIIIMALFGILGSVCGAMLSSIAPQSLLRKAFGVMLVISGMLSLKKKSAVSAEDASAKHL
ncbi:MAG: sulfite exporter TauE/SafE family protein [Clostridia bacterium]|nr:sulfite exporter TauE/SafE family protein [Clostridia bacterium]